MNTKFVPCLKLAVRECGLGKEWVRAPRLPLAGTERKRVLGVIRQTLEARSALAGLAARAPRPQT